MSKKGERKKFLVHRLVASAFIGNNQNFRVVNHKNGIKDDNRIENLEWCTHQENTIHAWKTGLIKETNIIKYNEDKKKVVLQIDLFNDKVIKEWEYVKQASDELKIDQGDIAKCCNGKIRQAGGFRWKYRDFESNMYKPKQKGMEILHISVDETIVRSFKNINEAIKFLNIDMTRNSFSYRIKKGILIENCKFVYAEDYYISRKG